MRNALAWLAKYRKTVVAVAGVAITVAIQVWGTGNKWVSLAVLAATVAGIYRVPNTGSSGAAARRASAPAAPRAPDH